MKKIIIFILIIICLCLGISYFYYVHDSNAKKYIENWNIELPSNMESIYEKKTDIGFQGDGEYFEIFKLKYDDKFYENFTFDKNTDFEILFTEYLTGLNINKENYPDFNEEYYWQTMEKNKDNKLLMILNKNKTRLYIIQILA